MDWIMCPFTWGFGSLLEYLIVPLPHLLMKGSNSVRGHFENPGKWVHYSKPGWPINHTRLQTYVTSANLSWESGIIYWHGHGISIILYEVNSISWMYFFFPSLKQSIVFYCTLLWLVMIYRRSNDTCHSMQMCSISKIILSLFVRCT